VKNFLRGDVLAFAILGVVLGLMILFKVVGL